MLDLILLAVFAALLIRGWSRGLIRELIDVGGLIVGVLIGFRFSDPIGAVLAEASGFSPEITRVVAGFGLFLMVGIGASLLGRVLNKAARLPGLNVANRSLGAGLGLAWGVVLATVLLTVAVAVPAPAAVDDTLSDSTVADILTNPAGPAQTAFQAAAGDKVLESLVNLDRLLDRRSVVLEPGEVFLIDPTDNADADPEAAQEIFESLNLARIDAGEDPLAWSQGLADVGLDHALDMYRGGYVGHVSQTTGMVVDRLADAGIPFVVAGENLALSASPESVHEGLIASDGHRANIVEPRFSKVGVGVLSGPLGLMVVQVFTG